MTSKVTVEAQSHPCEVRLMPRLPKSGELWGSLSEETRRFAQFTIPIGETRDYYVHSGQSIMVREFVEDAARGDSGNPDVNRYDEPRAAPEIAPSGRYLLRGYNVFDKPYEADLVEWSAGGRLRMRHRSGAISWLEGSDIPFIVEPLVAEIETDAHD